MRLTNELLSALRRDFAAYRFENGEIFRWSPKNRRIEYVFDDEIGVETILHELAHAELSHQTYERDIELIRLERDAWEHAKIMLAPRYNLEISSDIVENDLDSYRDWLHARSTCPSCDSTGIQTGEKEYTCVACRHRWRVNRAVTCGLRRYSIAT